MKARLKESWKQEVLTSIAQIKAGTKTAFVIRTEETIAITWLVLRFSEAGIPFKILRIGGHVQEFTIATDICPKCHGTGRL